MTRSLRRKHRYGFFLLALLVPCAFAASLHFRHASAARGVMSEQSRPQLSSFGPVVWTSQTLWPNENIVTKIRRGNTGEVAIEFASRSLIEPDLLLYWAPGRNTNVDALPSDARFLAAVQFEMPIFLPTQIRGEAGRLMFYSLADHEVISTSAAFIVQKE